jgi:hypothetical protein
VQIYNPLIARITGPVILLSHIPLARDNRECGSLREKGTIRPGVGFGYQNTLGTEVTNFLLESLKPAAVFRSVSNYLLNFNFNGITVGMIMIIAKSVIPLLPMERQLQFAKCL